MKMLRADGIFCQQHGVLARIPDGQRPIPDQFPQAVRPPLFIRRRDDGHVRGIDGQGVAHIADEVGAIVQAAVPGDDSARRRNTRLLLAMRFLRGVEVAIEDPYAALRIRFVAVGAVRSKSRADLLDVVRSRRLTFKIPSSKLDTHDLLSCFPFDLDMFLTTVFLGLRCSSTEWKPAISAWVSRLCPGL